MKQGRTLNALLISFLSLLLSGGVYAESSSVENERDGLIIAATDDWRPYAMKGEDGSLQGLSVEVFTEVAKRAGFNIKLSLMPAKRLSLQFRAGELDANFADSPLWMAEEDKAAFQFSEPYTAVKEFIYFKSDGFIEVETPHQLLGRTVGINRGYYYAVFEDFFENRTINRIEAPSNEHLYRMLGKGRLDAAFFDDVLFNFLLAKNGQDSSAYIKGMQLSTAPLSIKVPTSNAHLIPDINKAIADMKEDGSLAKILSRYANPI